MAQVTSAGNDCMRYVAHLTGLNELDLYGTRISTTGLKHLTQLKSLEILTLPGYVTDTNLALIGGMTSLKALYLVESRITDEGLAHMVGQKKTFKAMSVEKGIEGIVTPLHPGAIKFWKEKGVLK